MSLEAINGLIGATSCCAMFGRKKNKEENRYYLLPGMGRANRRKHQLYLKVSIVVGLLVSALVAVLMVLLSRARM